MIFQENATLKQKLEILSDAAKYDVACTSSGVERKGKKGQIGNTMASGICHAFSSDGRCISLLKILFTNECIYNCKYCINRCTNDVPRATFTPEEVCTLTIEFYRRNYIEGLFLSSGIIESPDYTMELICKTLYDLRKAYRFNGYIHCKAVPGASKEMAPNKSRKTILTPMRQIQNGMAESRAMLGMKGGNQSAYWYTQKRTGRTLPGAEITGLGAKNLFAGSIQDKAAANKTVDTAISPPAMRETTTALSQWNHMDTSRGFVPSGQSTQMIIGATGESDYEIMAVTEALYQKFDLKRVFYSAFINVNQDASLPAVDGQPPLRREHRLYQADFLLRYYGFRADELLTEKRPFFNTYLDPKCDWALSHLEHFPVEINTADFDTLLRVPGIGTKSASRIVKARQTGSLDYQALKAIGVVMKRAIYFITCNGRMMYQFLKIDEDYITRNLLENDKDVMKGFGEKVTYKQLTLFDDCGIEG